uniref:Chromosome 10 open reading frame 82 n=1 Tax=Dromaius novaehollandiae TaxID=8790 RepID=A0A8C4JVA9_DRONO
MLYFMLTVAGHVPLKFCSIGTSYGGDSVVYMTLFCNATQRRKDAKNELRCIAATTPQLPPICCNEDVLQVLYDYNYKHHPNRLGTVINERSLLDPPIPGWTGFVPRAKVTELGHGVRYHVMAKNCFQNFKSLIDRVPYDPSIVGEVPHAYQRFYRPEGMMPKYTGHIPRKCLSFPAFRVMWYIILTVSLDFFPLLLGMLSSAVSNLGKSVKGGVLNELNRYSRIR